MRLHGPILYVVKEKAAQYGDCDCCGGPDDRDNGAINRLVVGRDNSVLVLKFCDMCLEEASIIIKGAIGLKLGEKSQ